MNFLQIISRGVTTQPRNPNSTFTPQRTTNTEKDFNFFWGHRYVALRADFTNGNGPRVKQRLDPFADIINKIFDPFFTTKEIDEGTGMGLSIIHGIMKDYGGTITVASQLGKGSSFHVYFPVIQKDPLPAIKSADALAMGKERILFIDDEEFLAELDQDMLERLGYHVTARRSSLEALATFKNTPHEFDMVITDQTMPDMTGAELARQMMQIRPDIPIILCTGYSNLIDEDSAKAIWNKRICAKTPHERSHCQFDS